MGIKDCNPWSKIYVESYIFANEIWLKFWKFSGVCTRCTSKFSVHWRCLDVLSSSCIWSLWIYDHWKYCIVEFLPLKPLSSWSPMGSTWSLWRVEDTRTRSSGLRRAGSGRSSDSPNTRSSGSVTMVSSILLICSKDCYFTCKIVI